MSLDNLASDYRGSGVQVMILFREEYATLVMVQAGFFRIALSEHKRRHWNVAHAKYIKEIHRLSPSLSYLERCVIDTGLCC